MRHGRSDDLRIQFPLSPVKGILTILIVLLPIVATTAQESTLTTLTPEERAWLDSHASRIELWFNPDFPPLEFADPEGKFVGMGADIMALVESRLATTFKDRVCEDWTRHLNGLEEGSCHLAPTIVRTAEREDYALFTTPYARVPVVIIAPAHLGRKMDLDDLEGRRVAVVKGFATEDYLRGRAGGRFEIVTVDTVDEGLRAVAFGQADAFIENLAVASYYIIKNGISNLQVVGVTDYEFVFRIAVSRKYPLLYSAIQKALDAIGPGELETIRNRWISLRMEEGLSAEMIRLLVLLGSFLVLMVLGLTVISGMLKRRLKEKIANLKAAREEAALSETRFRLLFQQAPLPLVEIDHDGGILGINEATTRSLGYTLEDVDNLATFFRIAFPDEGYRELVMADWKRAESRARTEKGVIENREYRIRCKDGSTRVFLVGARVIGERTVVSMMDIDERKRVESELAASRERFFTLFDMAPFSCVINDRNGRYLMVNRHFCERLGRSREEVIGRSMEDFRRIIDPETKREVMEELRETGRSRLREVRIEDESGGTPTILFASRTIEWGDEPAVLTATVDVTEKKRVEEALRKQEESLRVTLDSIDEAVIATDTEGRIVRMNPVAEGLTGWMADEAAGRPLHEVFRILSADTREPAEDPVTEILSTGKSTWSIRRPDSRRPKGRRIPDLRFRSAHSRRFRKGQRPGDGLPGRHRGDRRPGAAPAIPEDGSRGTARGRRGPRFQQHAGGHHGERRASRLRRGWRTSPGTHRHDHECRGTRSGTDEEAADLFPETTHGIRADGYPPAPSGRPSPRGKHQGPEDPPQHLADRRDRRGGG